MDVAPLRIAQISDTHLLADPEGVLLGVKTQVSLRAVLDLLQSEADQLDLIILSGDLSQDGSDAAYLHLADALKVFSIPIYYVPGNHDNAKVMARVYPRENISSHRHIILKNWHIILLNSQKPGAVEGYLEQAQLNYLQHCLQIYPEHHALIVFHHHPIPVGCEWLDQLGLSNASDFWHVLVRYPKVSAVLFGHVHQVYEKVIHGIQCYSTPSACIQFKTNQSKFALEKIPPGYRWFKLYPEGRLETGVRRVENYIGQFEQDAKGY